MGAVFDTSQVRALAARMAATGAACERNQKQVVTECARAIARDAKSRVPTRTHTLQNGIKVRVFFGASASVICDAVNTSGKPYAQFVEYGTSFTPAQPFLGPAAEANEDPFYRSAELAAYEALRLI